MDLTENQKRSLCALRAGLAVIGGVLVLGGGLCIFLVGATTRVGTFGWVVVVGGLFALLMAGALYLMPGWLLPKHRQKPRKKRAA